MNYAKKKRKAQESMGMSFTMIFSIILIVFFIVAAFFVIRAFLGTQKCVQTGTFVDDFKSEIKDAYNSPKFDDVFLGNVESGISFVCFADFSKGPIVSSEIEKKVGSYVWLYKGNDYNTFFYPKPSCMTPYIKVDNLDITAITKNKNPYCIEVKSGKPNIHVEKGLNDNLVKVS